MLAEPNLTALSGETASFLAGGEFPIPVPQSARHASRSSSRSSASASPSRRRSSATGASACASHPKSASSQHRERDHRSTASSIPSLTTRRAETTVELASGQSFAIAGLIQNRSADHGRQDSGPGRHPGSGRAVPFGQLPAPRNRARDIVTPYIVQPVSAPAPRRAHGCHHRRRRQPEAGLRVRHRRLRRVTSRRPTAYRFLRRSQRPRRLRCPVTAAQDGDPPMNRSALALLAALVLSPALQGCEAEQQDRLVTLRDLEAGDAAGGATGSDGGAHASGHAFRRAQPQSRAPKRPRCSNSSIARASPRDTGDRDRPTLPTAPTPACSPTAWARYAGSWRRAASSSTWRRPRKSAIRPGGGSRAEVAGRPDQVSRATTRRSSSIRRAGRSSTPAALRDRSRTDAREPNDLNQGRDPAAGRRRRPVPVHPALPHRPDLSRRSTQSTTTNGTPDVEPRQETFQEGGTDARPPSRPKLPAGGQRLDCLAFVADNQTHGVMSSVDLKQLFGKSQVRDGGSREALEFLPRMRRPACWSSTSRTRPSP